MDAVALVKELSAAFASGGPAAVAPYLAEDLRWFPGFVREDVAVRGREGYLAHHSGLGEDGVVIDGVLEDFEDLGEGRVLVSGELVVRRGDSEAERRPMFWLMVVQDDRVVSIAAHDTREEALTSVGAKPPAR